MKARVNVRTYGAHLLGRTYPIVGEEMVQGRKSYELEVASPDWWEVRRRRVYLFWAHEVTLIEDVA